MGNFSKTVDELEAVLARIRIRGFILLAVVVILGFFIGYRLLTEHRPRDYSYLSGDELQDGVDVYRLCMQTGSQTGCKMSVDNFTVYHGLKREQARREEERARLEAQAALGLE